MFKDFSLSLERESSLPKYQQIATGLENYIYSRHLPAGTQLPGDRQLADMLGTTAVTVNKSLNILVQKGILERKVGAGTFICNQKKFSKFRRIGLVCHEIMRSDPTYVNCFLDTFYEFWESRDYQVIQLHDEPCNYEKLLYLYELSGMFSFCPDERFHDDLKNLFESGFPLVSMGMRFLDLPEHSFGSDHEKIACNAVEYLKNSGHKNIGLIYSATTTSAAISYRGFAKAMWQSGLPINPDWILPLQDAGDFRKNLCHILTREVRPTVLIVYSLSQIPLLYETMWKLNLRIPDDISIIGMHDEKYWTSLDPPLTVYGQKLRETTIAASTQLEHIIEHGKTMKITEHYDSGTLIERGSCRKI